MLGGSRSSRLDKRLVFQDKLADNVGAGAWPNLLGGMFFIQVDVKQGVDVATVEKVLDEELAKILAEGPTAEELEQARTVFKAGFIRGIERIGGFGGKADALAECAVFDDAHDPGCFRDSLATLQNTSAADVVAAGKRWLSKGDHTLIVNPGDRVATVEQKVDTHPEMGDVPPADPKYTVSGSTVDRSTGVPDTATFPPGVAERANSSVSSCQKRSRRPLASAGRTSSKRPCASGHCARIGVTIPSGPETPISNPR